MPLPVSIALAGHTTILVLANVITTSIRALVPIAARIWGTDTAKSSAS